MNILKLETKTILGMIFTLLMIGAVNFSVAAQSINRAFPTSIKSRVFSGSVSGNKTYWYSLKAKQGSIITFNAKFKWTQRVNLTLDFLGYRGPDGTGETYCCAGDKSYVLVGGLSGTKEIEKSFTVKSNKGIILFQFSFNSPNLDYTITFDGIEFDDESPENEMAPDFSRTVVVPGRSGNNWINTGIDVKRGDLVILNAYGKVDVGAGWGIHSAFGTRRFAIRDDYPLNSRTRYGLVAQVLPFLESPAQKWSYGDSRRVTVSQSGTLYLTINDDAPSDNTGKFVVNVQIIRGR